MFNSDKESEYDSDVCDNDFINKYIIDYNIKEEDNKNQKDESIFTLSQIPEIKNNTKIQFKKKMINNITMNIFTYNEILSIHYFYNINFKSLFYRTKLFKEYVIICIFLKKYNILLTEHLRKNLYKNFPIKYKSKRFIKLEKEILDNYNFDYIENDQKLEEIDLYINGFIFYIKNIIILEVFKEKENLKDKISKYFDISKIFLTDLKIQIFSKWLNQLIKRIILFCYSYVIKNNIEIKFMNKSLEYIIHVSFIIVIKLILKLHYYLKLINKYEEKYLKLLTFLIIDYDETFINDLLNEEFFILALKKMKKNKILKIQFNSKLIINILEENLM